MKALHDVLESMRLSNGAYVASPSRDYSHVWIRDVVYTVLPYVSSECDRYEKAFYALFDMLHRYEWKIDIHTRQKPILPHEHIHARYSTELTEINEPWGHAQNDAIGLFLWGVGEGVRQGKKMLRNPSDKRILQKLVHYLACLAYWQAADNGMWEESVELHASSVGACVAGLKSVRMLVHVPDELIQNGERTLRDLLPRESVSKETDLALLSLIYPYQAVSHSMALQLLENVSGKLEREHGCIRYQGDRYYNAEGEAEWCFGFPWLGICYSILGDEIKAEEYWQKTQRIVPANGHVPELYIGSTGKPNGNTPLAWAVSMVWLLDERVAAAIAVR